MTRQLLTGGLLALLAAPLWAAQCNVDIEASDRIAFNTHLIEVDRDCREFTVHLHHTGRLEHTRMGHNWVLARAREQQAVANAGLLGGFGHSFVRPGDARVIASTRLLGGGESDSVTFPVDLLEDGEDYVFFCSFPGHTALMRGTLRLAD